MLLKNLTTLNLMTAGILAISATTALADNTNFYDEQKPIPFAVPSPEALATADDSGILIGLQPGYASTHWSDFDALFPADSGDSIKDNGFAARGYLGYTFNKFFGLEAGYTYLPQAKLESSTLTELGTNFEVKNYGLDFLAKLSIPVGSGFSVFTKVGLSYLHANLSSNTFTSFSEHHSGMAFGFGASYEFIPNFAIDASWLRYSGQGNFQIPNSTNSNSYQPDTDMGLIGISYRFPVNFS